MRRHSRIARVCLTVLAVVATACGSSDTSFETVVIATTTTTTGAEPEGLPSEIAIHDLVEGDCFDTGTDSGVISVVSPVPCDVAHQFEVVALFSYPATERPTDAVLVEWARTECRNVLKSRFAMKELGPVRLAFALPDELDWNELGDREVMCVHDAGPQLVAQALNLEAPTTSTTIPETVPATTDAPNFPTDLSALRQCLHTELDQLGSVDGEKCSTGAIVEASANDCPRGILETWSWSYDSFDCEASVYLMWWEYYVSRSVELDVDGVYLPQEVAAVRAFQRENQLAVDGHIGPLTWSAVDEFRCDGVRAPTDPDFCALADGDTWVPGDPLPESVLPLSAEG